MPCNFHFTIFSRTQLGPHSVRLGAMGARTSVLSTRPSQGQEMLPEKRSLGCCWAAAGPEGHVPLDPSAAASWNGAPPNQTLVFRNVNWKIRRELSKEKGKLSQGV